MSVEAHHIEKSAAGPSPFTKSSIKSPYRSFTLQLSEESIETYAALIDSIKLTDSNSQCKALIDSVSFIGMQLHIFPKPPFLLRRKVSKTRAEGDKDETTTELIPLMTPLKFDLASIIFEPHTDNQVRVCTAKKGEIVRLSERIIDEEEIINFKV